MSDKSNSIAYENLNRRMFDGVGEYGIPQIYPETFEGECEFIGFNYARGKCSNPEGKAVHFFLDDYQFDALWRNPDKMCIRDRCNWFSLTVFIIHLCALYVKRICALFLFFSSLSSSDRTTSLIKALLLLPRPSFSILSLVPFGKTMFSL